MITIADLIDVASKAGTLPMQVLLLLGLLIVGYVVIYQHREGVKNLKHFQEETKHAQDDWHDRIEAERMATTEERKSRINMLMDLMKDDTRVKADVAHAVENNTKAIEKLPEVMENIFERLLHKISPRGK